MITMPFYVLFLVVVIGLISSCRLGYMYGWNRGVKAGINKADNDQIRLYSDID